MAAGRVPRRDLSTARAPGPPYSLPYGGCGELPPPWAPAKVKHQGRTSPRGHP